MIAVIDRIEGKLAVLEMEGGAGYIEVPVKFLPAGVKDGNVLRVTFEQDTEEEQKRKDKAKEIQDRLRNRNK